MSRDTDAFKISNLVKAEQCHVSKTFTHCTLIADGFYTVNSSLSHDEVSFLP